MLLENLLAVDNVVLEDYFSYIVIIIAPQCARSAALTSSMIPSHEIITDTETYRNVSLFLFAYFSHLLVGFKSFFSFCVLTTENPQLKVRMTTVDIIIRTCYN